MAWHRVGALVKRNMKLNYRGIDPFIDIFWWPLFDLMLWGFASRGVAQQDGSLTLVWLSCLVVWQGCVRSNVDMSLSLLTELWSHNVVNIFASPLKLREWILSAMIIGCVNAIIVVLFGCIMAYVIYGVTILSFGFVLVPAFLLLVQSGWIIGFFTAGCIMSWGLKIQKLVWVLGWCFAPFSGLFYALSALPAWAYVLAKIVPMSYVFEGMRLYAKTGMFPLYNFSVAFLLNAIYSAGALFFFIQMFQQSRLKGLVRLETEG